jgi:hypothetical protein
MVHRGTRLTDEESVEENQTQAILNVVFKVE